MRSKIVAILDLRQTYLCTYCLFFRLLLLMTRCHLEHKFCACSLFNSNVEAMICAVSTCSKMADNTELAEKLWDFRNVVSVRKTFIRRISNLPFLAIFLQTECKTGCDRINVSLNIVSEISHSMFFFVPRTMRP
jgi:hypothetical protein